jgi:CheY-like chemotaxis protein
LKKKNVSIISNFNINRNLKIKSINEVRLKQVIINLLSNSFKFTLNGKIILSVDIISDKKLRIRISDTGVGFNKDEIKDIFSPFSQVYSNQNLNRNGSGLGLYIVKDILKGFGSDIQYDSQKDIGSTFWFDIEYMKEEIIIDPFNLFSETLKNMIYDINNGKKDNVNLKNDDNSSNNETEKLSRNKKNNIFQTHKYNNNNKLNKLLERRKKNFKTSKPKDINDLSDSFTKESKSKINYTIKQNYYMSNNNSSLMRCFSDFNALNNITDKNNIFKSKRQFNILICDDDSFTALSTRNLLLKCFNEKFIKTPEILFAHNGIECLYFTYQYLLKENPINVILMDENMPFINGSTVCILLKEMYEMNEIKIYILSSQDLDVKECKADGFYDKPLSKKDILEIFHDKI